MVKSKSTKKFPVLFGFIEQVQELALALQRQYREEAERDFSFCLGIFSRNRTLLRREEKKEKNTFGVYFIYRKEET